MVVVQVNDRSRFGQWESDLFPSERSTNISSSSGLELEFASDRFFDLSLLSSVVLGNLGY